MPDSTRLMLVEDDPGLVRLLSTLLELEGYCIITSAEHGEEALLAAIQAAQPDVILLDVRLGSASGLNLLRQLRSGAGGTVRRSPRVIMTSGQDLREECLAAGANDFILKPYMPDELLSKLKGAARS